MKKSVLILIVCLFVVGLFATNYRIQTVGADSGFDSSYDFDSSSDWDSDSSSGDGSGIVYLIYLCVEYPPLGIAVLTIIVVICLLNNKKKKEIIEKSKNYKLDLLDVNSYPEEKQLEIEAFNLYKQIQYAWMNFDYDTIRKYTTDEMYNMYSMQLDTLKVKNQKNVMYDIKYVSSKIKNDHSENNVRTITINMKVTCYDFIMDTKTNKVVRGMATKLNTYNYELTFVQTTEEKHDDICPQCGASVKGSNSGVCEYCKSTLISKNYTLVLSKKKMISQK